MLKNRCLDCKNEFFPNWWRGQVNNTDKLVCTDCGSKAVTQVKMNLEEFNSHLRVNISKSGCGT